MPEFQTEFPLDGDSWRHQLAIPDSIGMFNRAGAAAAMRELAKCAGVPPDATPPRPISELRDPIFKAIDAELARAAKSPYVESPELISASAPISLEHISIKKMVLRGASHFEEDALSQDVALAKAGKGCIVAALSDGSSSGEFSLIGAHILATRGADITAALLERTGEKLAPLSREFLWALTAGLYTELAEICAESKIDRSFAAAHILSATLHLAIVTPNTVTHLGLGDGYLRDGHAGSWKEARSLAPRELVLKENESEMRLPPFPAALFANAPAYEALIAHRHSAPHPPDEQSLEYLRELALLEEAMCFRVLSHTSARSAFRSPIEIVTDGLKYSIGEKDRYPFPLLEALDRLGESQARIASALWNLAAERWDFPSDSSTFCAPGCIHEILQSDDAELKAEMLERLTKSPVGNWLPKRLFPSIPETIDDLQLILNRAVKNESLRAVLSRHAAPIGRELLEKYFASAGLPVPPRDALLRQLYDDLGIVRLALPEQSGS